MTMNNDQLYIDIDYLGDLLHGVDQQILVYPVDPLEDVVIQAGSLELICKAAKAYLRIESEG